MFTPARAAISRVDAPVKPRAAKTSSAAERMRALVEPGASRAFSRAVLVTMTGCLERLTTPRQACAHDMAVELAYPSAHTRAGGVVDLTLHRRADVRCARAREASSVCTSRRAPWPPKASTSAPGDP